MSSDIYNLHRFVEAQNAGYELVLNELKNGMKSGHWMWYVFPQIEGLGITTTSKKYAISNQNEATAYLKHPILGQRLRDCTQLVVNLNGFTAEQIFSYPDVLKFRSCMTLFEHVEPKCEIFRAALLKYYAGKPDQLTLDILNRLENKAR